MDRRDFLKKGAFAVAGAMVGGSVISGLAGFSTGCTPVRTKRIGLQLYSLREMMGQNPEATLKLIAAMGYTELETANYDGEKVYGYAPADFRTLVEGLGMKVSSCHVGKNWEPENEAEIMAWWDKTMDDHKAMGCRYIVMPGVNLGETLEWTGQICGYWNKLGAMAKAKGMAFGYHNHSHEFDVIEDQVNYEYMLANTSADVFFELDVYWAQQGGHNPVELLNKYAGRFPVLHIKDESIIGDSGELDFEAIFNAAYAQGMKDYYVEVERYILPAEICVEKSFDFLNAAPYVK
jgi:sugar phosphate isomerase/epimerase